jgi:hypothetical protein
MAAAGFNGDGKIFFKGVLLLDTNFRSLLCGVNELGSFHWVEVQSEKWADSASVVAPSPISDTNSLLWNNVFCSGLLTDFSVSC